ncbi:MAG: MBL fold metallo-hydrolase [Eubacteriales bacterium]|nr:MBL fold metallo-hydrolase [Eubacteriales bacterium]
MNSEIFDTFGNKFERFSFPCNISRVTAGRGGEALLIKGTEKYALLDCGMAYCGRETADNIFSITDRLDYILLSHSHYDHIGGLPYIIDRFPEAVVCGSKKCASIIEKPTARKLMAELGKGARDLYAPGSDVMIITEGLNIDLVLHDGDFISLGEETVTAFETKGHTDCSLSYFLEPVKLLFTSESTGILEGKDYIHTPVLKSFSDAFASLEKCRGLDAEYLCLPHFGMLPKDYVDTFFNKFEIECYSKLNFVNELLKENLSEDEMFEIYTENYWTPAKLEEQPYEAFAINSRHILNALLRELRGGKLHER